MNNKCVIMKESQDEWLHGAPSMTVYIPLDNILYFGIKDKC